MAIQIIRNEDANAIEFRGSTFPVFYNGVLTASADADDANLIMLKVTNAKAGSDVKMYKWPYTDFRDADNVAFNSRQACIDYINAQANIPRAEILRTASTYTQGYYGLLSGFYFSEPYDNADVTTTITEDDVDDWVDINFAYSTPNSNQGLFDKRPVGMVEAQANGHSGAGTQADPITFKLEGLDLRSFCSFRSSMSFNPDTDEGQFEARLLFQRHSGTTPSTDFSIEDVVMTMSEGAERAYPAEPFLSFFVGDSIDTEAPGDAGTFRYQVKASVPGTVTTNALTLYINK